MNAAINEHRKRCKYKKKQNLLHTISSSMHLNDYCISLSEFMRFYFLFLLLNSLKNHGIMSIFPHSMPAQKK